MTTKSPQSRTEVDRQPAIFADATLVSLRSRHYSSLMLGKASRIDLNRLIIGVAAAAAMTCGTASAEDGSASARKGALPGVAGDYRIVKPAPAPEPDDALPSNGNGQFKIVNTDVRVSGSITVDVSTGGIRPPSR